MSPFDGPPGFRTPPPSARPKIRWWWPDPVDLNDEQLRTEVCAIAEAGFGGAEVGWLQSATGWGSAEWGGHVKQTLEAARAAGIRLDLTLGPSWPLATPRMSESLTQHELLRATTQVDGRARFAERLPAPDGVGGTLRLVAATAARVAPRSEVDGDSTALDPESAVDLTPLVGVDHALVWDVPDGRWAIFGFWQRATAQYVPATFPWPAASERLARHPEPSPDRWLVVDHFRKASVEELLRHLDDCLRRDGLEALLEAAASHVVEYSLVLQAELLWTPDFLTQFSRRRGYELTRLLPALFVPGIHDMGKDFGQPVAEPTFEFTGGIGERVRHDYSQTLTDLYIEEHLRPMAAWASEHGLALRSQVAYNNISLRLVRSAASVPVPEIETFGVGDPASPGSPESQYALDAYRAMSAGAHVSEARQVSIELGHVAGAVYGQDLLDLKNLVNRAYAAGVTQVVITGFPYAATGSPWPGWSPFMVISEPWSQQHPQWRDWSAFTTYLGRANAVLEHGTATLDVAIYFDGGIDPARETTLPGLSSMISVPEAKTRPLFEDPGLASTGYTYEYIDAHALTSADARAEPGQLFAHGPAYRALVLNRQRALPTAAAHAILEHARSGLPVVVIGPRPDRGAGLNDADMDVSGAMSSLAKLPNVGYAATEADVPDLLRQLGIEPAAAFPEPLPLLTARRRTATTDYWYVFNMSASPVDTTVTFATSGAPSALDLWTGDVTPLGLYRTTSAGIEVPISLPALGDLVLAFARGTARHHVEQTDADEVIVRDGALVVRDTVGGRRTVHLSDRRTVDIDLAVPEAPLRLDDWNLHVDETLPSGTAVHDVELDGLRDWRSIDQLEDAVGIGRYVTTVRPPASALGPDRGIFLDVGAVHGSMRVGVNGHRVTQQVVPGGRWSIGHLLRPGPNEITVEVATNLRNRVVALAAGDEPHYAPFRTLRTLPCGLLGPVQLTPFSEATIE